MYGNVTDLFGQNWLLVQGLCSELAEEPSQLEQGLCNHQVCTGEAGDGPWGQHRPVTSVAALTISPVQSLCSETNGRRERKRQFWVHQSLGQESTS